MDWLLFKQWFWAASGLGKDALHIYAGLLIQGLALLLLRLPPRSPVPLALILLAALVNETLDLSGLGRAPDEAEWRGSLKDVVNTLLAPAIIVIVAAIRHRRQLKLQNQAAGPY